MSMNIIVSHESALAFWSQVRYSIDDVTTPSSLKNTRNTLATAEAIKVNNLQAERFGAKPIHLLVNASKRRVQTKQVICHQSTCDYPTGSFRRIRDGLLIASPELCFLQMATKLSLPKLVKLGCFFCGTYADITGYGLVNDRKPLTSKAKLIRYMEKCKGLTGHSQAARASKLICENVASPQEARLAILLSFPLKLGGFGFPPPVANHKITFPTHEQQLYGRQFVVLDLYWPQWKLGIEYDGREYHGESDAIARDREKSSEMAAKRIEIIRVDRQQLRSPKDVYVLAKKIGRISKHYVLKPTQPQWAHKQELFWNLAR